LFGPSDEDDAPPVTAARPPRLGLARVATVVTTLAWLGLGAVVLDSLLLLPVWLLALPFVVSLVVFGLDAALHPIDRRRTGMVSRAPG
jgi:hypothetical protein